MTIATADTPLTGNAKTLRRKDVTRQISEHLRDVKAPVIPLGSTVGNRFLDQVVRALGGDPSTLKSTYRKIEFALAEVGEGYDKEQDSSEHRGASGGGTVTNGGWRKLLRGLTKRPQCFILAIADHPISADYDDVPGESYGFDDKVSGRVAFLEAGRGSRVVFYRTAKASELPRQTFIAHAVIDAIVPVEGGRYRADLTDYEEFDRPVPVTGVAIQGWNRQHGIAEIDFDTLERLVRAGTSRDIVENVDESRSDSTSDEAAIPSPVPSDIVEEGEAARTLVGLVPVNQPLDLSLISEPLPEVLPTSESVPSPEITPSLEDDDESVSGETKRSRSGASQRALNRYTEHRAVFLAKSLMAREGWRLHRDCQALGVGYDLEYRKEGARRNVEVKGIQGAKLEFNLTAKEWIRVLEDPDFVVIAVTGVLSPSTTRLHILTSDHLLAASRRPVQYRMTVHT